MPNFNKQEWRTIEAKTASYRMTALDHGKIFTNRGAAGAVTLTLPPTADINTGWSVEVVVVADQNVVVASNTADTIVAFNDATADSIAFSTTSEKIGNALEFIWDGTGWLSKVSLGAETATPTIAT